MNYKFRNSEFSIIRYPNSDNRSLKAWNSADEHILKYIDENSITDEGILLYNDRFGFLSSFLIGSSPKIIIESKSQEKAIRSNFEFNKLDFIKCETFNPLDELQTKVELCVVKIPKSMDLFRLYLQHLSEVMVENSKVICGFMTKYFTPQMLDIANEYFEKIEQSLAWKKSRLLILSKPKEFVKSSIINEVKLNDNVSLKQYFGVFSGNNIDYATQFLIEHLNVKETDIRVLDLGSGNGVLAFSINEKNADCEIHLIDDSYLATESSKLNLKGENVHFNYSDNLEKFDDNYFDFIVSNPPFHFEYENNSWLGKSR